MKTDPDLHLWDWVGVMAVIFGVVCVFSLIVGGGR